MSEDTPDQPRERLAILLVATGTMADATMAADLMALAAEDAGMTDPRILYIDNAEEAWEEEAP